MRVPLQTLIALLVLTSWTSTPTLARPTDCSRLAAGSDAKEDPDTAWARALFEAVVAAEARVDPSATRPALRVVADEQAITSGGAGEAGAWYCVASDTVFLSRALITYAALARASAGADFLAFALAHELAHRRFDRAGKLDPRPLVGTGTAHGGGSTTDRLMEARADHRAVFLLALAKTPEGRSFAPFALSHYRTLETFLSAERGLARDGPFVRARVAAIEQALSRMTRVRDLYDAALAVAFQPGGVAELFAIAAELAPESSWDAVPELWVLRAHAHLAAANADGWCPPELAGLRLPACIAQCAAIFPAHARIAPSPSVGSPRRSATDRAAELAAARVALSQAGRLGMSAVELSGAEACLAFAERDPGRALSALERVPRHTATAAARTANRRIFEQQRVLLEAVDPAELQAHEDPAPLAPSPPPHQLRALAERVATLTCVVGACVRIGGTELATLADTELRAWQSACEMSAPGMSDHGLALFVVRCPRWDSEGVVGWTLMAQGDRVQRATRVRRL